MEPKPYRLDFHAATWAALRAAVPDQIIITSSGADMDPGAAPVTVLTEPQAVQATVRSRGVHSLSFEVLTYSDREETARAAHIQVADAVLELQTVAFDGVQGRVSAVRCEIEPVALKDPSAPEWPGVLSRYTMYVRTWR